LAEALFEYPVSQKLVISTTLHLVTVSTMPLKLTNLAVSQ